MEFLYYAAVFAFGAAVGIGELVSRYRDAPSEAIRTVAAIIYIAINGIAACFALWLIQANNWTFGATDAGAAAVWQVLVAGFGAIAFFRSSLFSLRVGDNDVQVGPSAFLQIILNAADRSVDRSRAEPRAVSIADIMKDVTFEKAHEALPTHCFALMQNVSAEEQEQVGQVVSRLAASGIGDDVKALNLGLLLMNLVGEDVLRAAVDSLGEQIKGPVSRANAVTEMMDKVSFEKAHLALPTYCFALHGNVSHEEQVAFALQIEGLAASEMADKIKALQLGLALIDAVGESVVGAAVQSLGIKIHG